jgi:hypothetical protein
MLYLFFAHVLFADFDYPFHDRGSHVFYRVFSYFIFIFFTSIKLPLCPASDIVMRNILISALKCQGIYNLQDTVYKVTYSTIIITPEMFSV